MELLAHTERSLHSAAYDIGDFQRICEKGICRRLHKWQPNFVKLMVRLTNLVYLFPKIFFFCGRSFFVLVYDTDISDMRGTINNNE